MKVLCISFHNGNINPAILAAQSSVFRHLEIPLVQFESSRPHGEMMDEGLLANEWDIAAVFDIDAIPTSYLGLMRALRIAAFGTKANPIIIGGAHNANHLRWEGALRENYASPACSVISKESYLSAMAYNGAGFAMFGGLDCGQFLSLTIKRMGGLVALSYPKFVREPLWRLQEHDMHFGRGTDYGWAYHEFESRTGKGADHFCAKCAEVCSTNDREVGILTEI